MRSWIPLAPDDPLASAASGALDDVAAALARASLETAELARGQAGLALFFGRLVHDAPERYERYAALAESLLESAGEALDEIAATPGLFHGYTGVAWVGDHLRGLFDARDPEVNEEIDAALAEALEGGWSHGFDVISGLVGVGVYALERRGVPSGDRGLALVLARLAEAARPDGAFFTGPELLPAPLAEAWPQGRHDLGLAHGTPGVVSFLARCLAAGVEEARPLLEGATRWLLARRRDDLATRFAALEAPDRPPVAARSGWCYGDAGVALALACAGQALGEGAVVDAALSIARHAAERPFAATGVQDAGFCHGAAALAHICGRLAQLGGDEELAAARRAWIGRVLEARDPSLAASGGFYQAGRGGERVAALHLLEGAAGVGLVLLAATTVVDPSWDAMFVTRPPDRY